MLKLDIEGAEGTVLDWFLSRNMFVPQVLLEFDEMTRPSAQSKASVQQLVDRLLAAGYQLAITDGPANALFVRG